MSKQDWVVTTPNLDFRCKRCGEHYQPNTPVSIDMWVVMSKSFCKAHKHCTAIAPNNNIHSCVKEETE